MNGKEEVENINTYYKANGRGKLYLNNGTFIEANFINDKMEGQVKITFRSFTLHTEYSDNEIKEMRGKFVYDDNSSYEGEYDKKFMKHGKGVSNYADGRVYNGNWNKGVFHGSGHLFVPEKNKTVGFISNSAEMPYGQGTYTSGNWINGLLTGQGSILNSKGKFKCLWRYGTLISSVYKMTNKVKLHENIFTFLNPQELNTILKVPNKVVDNYFSKKNMEKLIELRLINLIDEIDYNLNTTKTGFNSDICNFSEKKSKNSILFNRFKNRIQNVQEVFLNALSKKDELIPIVSFKSDGGINQKRFHHSHILHPDPSKAYCTHPLIDKKQNITVSGVICADIMQEIANIKAYSENGIVNDNLQNNKQNEISLTKNHDKIKSEILNILDRNSTSNKDLKKLLINYPKLKQILASETRNQEASDYIKSTTAYSQAYDKLFHLHEIDYYKIHIQDQKVLEKCTSSKLFGNKDKGLFFSLHDITVYTPIFLSMYTVLNNPVRTLAIFLHNEELSDGVLSNTLTSKPFTDLKDLKTHPEAINYQEKPSHSYIEFSHPENNLIAIIQIKDYTQPILVSLKRYSHFGKFVTLKLIDQSALYGANVTGIDCGTVLFYGQIFNINAI